MAYTGHNWMDGESPALDAENLNKMEAGIEAAHDGVEEAKLLANTNTILLPIKITLTAETQHRYKIPIDNFSFDNYWIFGSIRRDDNTFKTDRDGWIEPWFEIHEAGTLIGDYSAGPSRNISVSIDSSGVMTFLYRKGFYNTDTVTSSMLLCVFPIAKKNIIPVE